MQYKCSKCGSSVTVILNHVIKICQCDATIIAEMKATATGTGVVNKEKEVNYDRISQH